MRLKIAAMMLFWFGIVWQSLHLMRYLPEIFSTGTMNGLTYELIFADVLWGIIFIPYTLFGHLIHIGAGYWISKGSKIAVIVGVGLSLYEIISFFVPEVNPAVLSVSGITVRVFFGIVIVLLVLGSKDLSKLKTENWRPWKHPKSS